MSTAFFLSTSRRDLTFPKKSLEIEMVPVPVELFSLMLQLTFFGLILIFEPHLRSML